MREAALSIYQEYLSDKVTIYIVYMTNWSDYVKVILKEGYHFKYIFPSEIIAKKSYETYLLNQIQVKSNRI